MGWVRTVVIEITVGFGLYWSDIHSGHGFEALTSGSEAISAGPE